MSRGAADRHPAGLAGASGEALRAGDPQAVLDVDQALHANREHWLVREIISMIRRTLKRMAAQRVAFIRSHPLCV